MTGSVAHLGSSKPNRVAVLSVHTSPLDQPGTGDAGGMNVYVLETAQRMADLGIHVDIFTRATSSRIPNVVEIAPRLNVRHITAGPYEGLDKNDLPGQLCAMTSGVMRVEAAHPEGWYDLIHSHYWLSGQVGWLASERWNIPLVHSMHTMARVKNQDIATGDRAEPRLRVIGEDQVVAAADRLIANTDLEADQLIDLYGAKSERIDVVHPGVDLSVFHPGNRVTARTRFGFGADDIVVLFVGRIQPLKAPDIVVQAAAQFLERHPQLRDRLRIVVCGGPSGTGRERPTALVDLAHDLGVFANMRFEPPSEREHLAELYRAADVTMVPSHSESFGLVAVESQACGTPVIAADVGGLRTAVRRDESGLLIPGHDPHDYAAALERLLLDQDAWTHFAKRALQHAQDFSWDRTTFGLLESYAGAMSNHRKLRATR
jgi:D-inositol-3-phosphate glycosyltransferase